MKRKNYDVETRGRNKIPFKEVSKEDGEWMGVYRASRVSGHHYETIKKAGERGDIKTKKMDNRVFYFMKKEENG